VNNLKEIDKMIFDLDLNDLLKEKETEEIVIKTPKCPKFPFYLKLSAWGDVFTN
jgi:hypothetical protein